MPPDRPIHPRLRRLYEQAAKYTTQTDEALDRLRRDYYAPSHKQKWPGQHRDHRQRLDAETQEQLARLADQARSDLKDAEAAQKRDLYRPLTNDLDPDAKVRMQLSVRDAMFRAAQITDNDEAARVMRHAGMVGDRPLMAALSMVAEERGGWDFVHQMWADNDPVSRPLLERLGETQQALLDLRTPRYRLGDLEPPGGMPPEEEPDNVFPLPQAPGEQAS